MRCSQGFARSTGDVRQPGRLVSGGYPGRRLVCSRASSIGLRCRFCEVHRRHLMHGGTQTIRFWGLQHVHWCEGSCCWFAAAKQVGLRCSQGFARSTGDVRQPGRLVSGGYPGRRLVCSRASSIGLRCRFCEVHRRHLMHGGTQTIRFWGLQHVHWCEGSCCWFAAAKQVGLRCSQGFARSTGDVRQPGRLVSGGYPGRRLVCSRASSIGLRCRFCEVHRRHLMHGGTQTIRFWGLQHVHWCEGSCCWFAAAKQVGLRCSQGFARSTGDVRQPGRLVSGGYPGRRLVCSRASSIGLRCRFCEVHRRHLMHGGTQTIRFWGLQHVHWCEGSCCWFAAAKQVGLRCSQGFARSTGDVRQPGRLVSGGYPGRRLVCSRASSIGLRCRFCEVHRRHLMHGGTQTIRFWGLQHVHWCEGSCCWFAAAKQVGLRCSQGFARSTGDVRQPGRLVSGGYPGRRLVCSRASSIGLRCRFCEVHRRHLMHGGTQTIRFWGLQHVHWCEGSCCWFAAAKQVGLRCSQGFARSTGDVRQPGRLVSGGYPGRRLVCSRASSIGLRCRFCEVHRRHLMHGGTQTIRFWGLQHVHWCEGSCCWFAAAKQVGLRCSQGFARSTGDVRQPGRLVSGGYRPEGLGKLMMPSAKKEKKKTFEKLEYI